VNNSDREFRVSRRAALGALPVVALTAAACTSRRSPDEIRKEAGTQTTPATPQAAVDALMQGNARFAESNPQIRDAAEVEILWTEITSGQTPFAMVLGCADSRLAPEIVFDQFVGDIFVVREAGNIAESPTNLGSLEYGQAVLQAKALMVLGHSGCGAVQAAFDDAKPGGNIQSIVDVIRTGIVGAKDLDDAIVRNVKAVMQRVRKGSPLLTEAERRGDFAIVGAFYDIESARVRLL